MLEAQGYTVEHSIVYHDNKSTIILATNERASSSRNTKHIRNRYFLVKDFCDRLEIKIRHEGTKIMWSDVLAKRSEVSKWDSLLEAHPMGGQFEYHSLVCGCHVWGTYGL